LALILLERLYHFTTWIRLHPRFGVDDPWAIANDQNRLIFTWTGNIQARPELLTLARTNNADLRVDI